MFEKHVLWADYQTNNLKLKVVTSATDCKTYANIGSITWFTMVSHTQTHTPGGVPGDAGTGKLAGYLMLQTPLTEVHHVWSFINAHHSVRRASGQHQAHVLWGKLHICY